ncbi:MAG: TIGR03032 family protein [Prolixibacteraceae bacterium]|nr:TIGR03032 family protein [Prolixibacteraceae bacterium]MBN2648428.1 TIGR03032 family protein [Prolixibacteraceae bacterium]
MNQPFFFYNNAFPDFLYKNNCSIIFSTYQAGKVIVINSINGQSLQMFAKNFKRPMGIAINGEKLAVANRNKIDIFSNSHALAINYPDKPKYYKTLYLPQVTYYTGMADIHEIEWGKDGLWAVNTAFSCLCQMDEEYSFIPKWFPPFISDVVHEDRCHLNGMAMKDNEPAYVTMFDNTDTKDGWRNGNTETGMIIDVRNNKTIADKLPMPHSPALDGNNIFFLLSATGSVMKLNTNTEKITEIARTDKFLRGLSIMGDYIIAGASELRDSSKAFGNIDITKEKSSPGIIIFEKHTGEAIARLTFTDHIKEIFSVKSIKNAGNISIMTEKDEWSHRFIHGPDKLDYWAKKNNG